MKISLFSLLIFFSLSATSQTSLPNNFKIGDYVEIFGEDSIKVFFNCRGMVVDKKCALYFRIGKMDSSLINVTGNFSDYYVNGNIFLKATLLNNKLEGVAQYYHANGKVKEEGRYQDDIRQGKWVFYYPDGSVEKVYEYADGEPTVWEVYSSDGKATVVNGNGKFTTTFNVGRQCSSYEATGQLLNGKRNGRWTFFNLDKTFHDLEASRPIGYETYKDGIFIKGSSKNYDYTDDPKIALDNFYPNEGINLLENLNICYQRSFFDLQYAREHISASFFPQLQKKLSEYKESMKNQWLVVGITISENDKLGQVNVASSINDVNLENYIYGLLTQMTKWKTAIEDSKKVESHIFFTVLVDNNQIIIPRDYISRNSGN